MSKSPKPSRVIERGTGSFDASTLECQVVVRHAGDAHVAAAKGLLRDLGILA
jgi:hypothetical protein